MTTARMQTVYPDRRPVRRKRPRPARPGMRLLRGLSGALAAGLVVLTVMLAVGQWLGGSATVPGPGVGTVVGHCLGAVVAVLAQAVADRSRGEWAVTASVVVLAVVMAVLWMWWWR